MAGQYQYLTATERRELHDLAATASRELNQNDPGDGNRLMELLRRSLADVQHGRDVAASLRTDLRAARQQRDAAEARANDLSTGCGQLSGAVHQNRQRAEAAEGRLAAARALATDWRNNRGILGAVLADELDNTLGLTA